MESIASFLFSNYCIGLKIFTKSVELAVLYHLFVFLVAHVDGKSVGEKMV